MTSPLPPRPARRLGTSGRDLGLQRPARRTLLAAGGVIGLLTLAACGNGSGYGGSSSSGSSTQAAAVGLGTTSTSMGTILTDSAGRTLYAFAADTPGQTNCSDQCLVYWPPDGTGAKAPKAPSGVTAKLGVITRPDGTKQLTANNWPLYTYVGDQSTGDTTGQGLNTEGGLWWVVGTNGQWIKATGSGSSASTAPYTPAGGRGGY